MQLRVEKSLHDILDSISSIEDFMEQVTGYQEYQDNKIVKRAVEREIEIIGEATNRILKIDAEFSIKNARKIVDTRNWVIHSYDAVDDIIIYGIVTLHLPKLKKEIILLLK